MDVLIPKKKWSLVARWWWLGPLVLAGTGAACLYWPRPGQRLHVAASRLTISSDLLAALPEKPGQVVADKAYDTNAVLGALAAQQAEQVIPPKSNRLVQREYDENLYEDRNKIERCFGRFNQARAFATRYDKTALSFLAVAHIVAALDWLR